MKIDKIKGPASAEWWKWKKQKDKEREKRTETMILDNYAEDDKKVEKLIAAITRLEKQRDDLDLALSCLKRRLKELME